MFQKFPPEIYSLVSKSHCIIKARRKRVLLVKKAAPEMIAETLCMNELRDNLPEPPKSRKKKNPRIMVNGEKVVDSDIEDKKEAQRFLSVERKSKPSEVEEEVFYTCPEETKQYRYEEEFEIEDFSTNGTYLNGKRLAKNTPTVIRNNDEIGIVVMQPEKPGTPGQLVLGYIFRDT